MTALKKDSVYNLSVPTSKDNDNKKFIYLNLLHLF